MLPLLRGIGAVAAVLGLLAPSDDPSPEPSPPTPIIRVPGLDADVNVCAYADLDALGRDLGLTVEAQVIAKLTTAGETFSALRRRCDRPTSSPGPRPSFSPAPEPRRTRPAPDRDLPKGDGPNTGDGSTEVGE